MIHYELDGFKAGDKVKSTKSKVGGYYTISFFQTITYEYRGVYCYETTVHFTDNPYIWEYEKGGITKEI